MPPEETAIEQETVDTAVEAAPEGVVPDPNADPTEEELELTFRNYEKDKPAETPVVAPVVEPVAEPVVETPPPVVPAVEPVAAPPVEPKKVDDPATPPVEPVATPAAPKAEPAVAQPLEAAEALTFDQIVESVGEEEIVEQDGTKTTIKAVLDEMPTVGKAIAAIVNAAIENRIAPIQESIQTSQATAAETSFINQLAALGHPDVRELNDDPGLRTFLDEKPEYEAWVATGKAPLVAKALDAYKESIKEPGAEVVDPAAAAAAAAKFKAKKTVLKAAGGLGVGTRPPANGTLPPEESELEEIFAKVTL